MRIIRLTLTSRGRPSCLPPPRVRHLPPLMDRMERVDLQEYSEDELGKIVRVGMDDYKLTDEAVAEIATTPGTVLLPSAATRLLVIVTATRSRCSLLTTGVTSARRTHSASGLAQQGVGVAPHLSRKRHRLTELAAITCLSKGSIQKDYELFLMKQGLMEIGKNSERALTVKVGSTSRSSMGMIRKLVI